MPLKITFFFRGLKIPCDDSTNSHVFKFPLSPQKSAKEDSKDNSMSPVDLAQQVSQLQEQLYGLHLEKILGTSAIQEAADPQATLPK